MAEAALLSSLKSLQLGLRQSFLLKNQCSNIVEVLKVVEADIKANSSWYKEGQKFSFKLLTFLKRFLRFARMHLRVTDRFPKGLGDLRKARSLCNVNKLRMDLNAFASELQVLLLCSGSFSRIGASLGPILSGERLAKVYQNDSEAVHANFDEVFASLKSALPDKRELIAFVDIFSQTMSTQRSFDSYDSPKLREFSYVLEEELLGMTVNDPTKFTDLAFNPEKFFREGRFGTILKGKLGGPSPVCIQKISKDQLQTLSSEGRVKLFQTVRSSKSKTSPSLLSVLGVTFHEGALYVSLEDASLSLKDLLHGESQRAFSSDDILAVFHAVSGALIHLHKEAIIHGDIRPDNIFFGRKGQDGFCKLAMFSYELNLDELHWSTWNEEALVYQAPEVLGNKQFSPASDIYSVAICMWEITQSNRTPFDAVNRQESDLIGDIKAGMRPEFTGGQNEPGWLVHEAQKAWDSEPSKRPSAEELKEILELLIADNGVSEADIVRFIGPTVKRREKGGSKVVTQQPKNVPVEQVKPPASPYRDIPPIPEPREQKNNLSPGRQVPPIPLNVPVSPARTGGSRPLPPIEDVAPPPLPRRQEGVDQYDQKVTHGTIDKVEVQREYSSPVNNQGPNSGLDDADAIGVNGLTAGQVRQELIKFYTQNDPDMLKELNDLVTWCMMNGLEEFDRLLVEKFGKGLPMYEGIEMEPMTPSADAPSKPRGGLASIFSKKKHKSPAARRPVPELPPKDTDFGFDADGPPPMPPRGGKPPGL